MKKRMLAALLALCMVLSCIPAVAAETAFDSFFTGLQGTATVENDATYPFTVSEDGPALSPATRALAGRRRR